MSTLAIHNGRVIDPALGWDGIADVVIVDGRITRVGPNEGDMVIEADRIDASGLIVAPGFVDLQTHLREPGFEHEETIATGTRAAARGGFTTVCAMPGTVPPLDSRAAVESVLREAEASALVRVLPIGCITAGRKGELLAPAGELAGAGVVALTDVQQPRDTADVAQLLVKEPELSTGQGQDNRVSGCLLDELCIVVPAGLGPVTSSN